MQRRPFTSKLEIFRKIEIAPRRDSRNVNEGDKREKERDSEWKRFSHGVIKTLKVSKSLQTPRNLQKPFFLLSLDIEKDELPTFWPSVFLISFALSKPYYFLISFFTILNNNYNLGYFSVVQPLSFTRSLVRSF